MWHSSLALVLAVVSIFVTGVVAAVPIPGMAPQFRHDHARLIVLAMDLAGALPIVLLAWVVGQVMIRITGTGVIAAVVAAPWVILGLYDRVFYLRNCGATFRTALSILLNGHNLAAWTISLLCLPVGLWFASLTRRRFARTP